MPTPLPTIFLSYARGDDEPFVRRLKEDLTARGFEVWFDRDSMPSRGLTFHQEIRDAVAAHDRLLLVVGPWAAASEYVRQEWQFAWFEAEKVVTPILRLGDFPIIPDELKLLHCEDFREDTAYETHLNQLVRILREPIPPLGKLIGVPSLPAHYLSRTDRLIPLRNAIRSGLDSSAPLGGVVAGQQFHGIAGASRHIGMHGMGGIGKSVLANLLARDREIRKAFSDAIVWVGLGSLPNVADLLRRVHRELGGDGAFDTTHEGKTNLKELLADKAVLLVLDDAWRREDVDAFDVLGPRCRALVTTRNAGLLSSLGSSHHLVELLTDEEALRLLAVGAEVDPDALPAEAREVLTECGRLPLAVALAGGMVRAGTPWRDVRDALREHELEIVSDEHGVEQHQSLWKMIEVSVRALPEEAQERLAELAVFPEDEAVPAAAVCTLWQHTGSLGARQARRLLVDLKQRSLLQITDDAALGPHDVGRVSLHDLICDYCVRRAEARFGSLTVLHGKLLAAYQAQCPEGWATGPDDGYFLTHLTFHLVRSGRDADAQSLLSDRLWIGEKLSVLGVEAVLSDLDVIIQSALEREDWAIGLGAAVAGAQIVERSFQLPPSEVIPLFARVGAGRHAVEMARYVEGEYSRAYLLLDIANAAEKINPTLARRIRRQLWSAWKNEDADSSCDSVIVCRLAYADMAGLMSYLSHCTPDRFREIIGHLLGNENTVHRLVDMPSADIASICDRLLSMPGKLTEHESVLVAGFHGDRQLAESRIDFPTAQSLLEIRQLSAESLSTAKPKTSSGVLPRC